MNTQFENFITTYKNILKSRNRDIKKAYFFALNSLKNHNVMKFKPSQQVIINKLKYYYRKPTLNGKNELNDLITQYYIDGDDEIDEEEIDEEEINENEVIDDNEDENKVIRDIFKKKKLEFNLEDVVVLENYSIAKLLSLYDITLKPFLDDDIIGEWLCEDQLEFSEPYKREFLQRTIKKRVLSNVIQLLK